MDNRLRAMLLCLLMFWSCALFAQDGEIDRTHARLSGAMSPPSTQKVGTALSPDHTAALLGNMAREVRSNYFDGFNEDLKTIATANQIGEGFPLAFHARDLAPQRLKKAGDRFAWTVPVSSTGAHGMRLKLDLSNLEADDQVFLVDADSLYAFGPYSAEKGEFWGPLVDGETTLVTLVSNDANFGDFSISEGSHIFKRRKAAKACEDDLNCENSQLRDVATAVGHYSFVSSGSTYVCTGTLLRAEDNSFQPYFLTANHCVGSQSVASTVHVYWDYRSTGCNSGQGVNKSSLPQNNGSQLLATNSNLDTTLLLLNGNVGQRHFMGWNATAVPAVGTNITCIHHPAGDYMRVSKGTVTATGERACGNSYTNEIRIDWIDSLTEGGSSGSAIFNDNFEVVGDESGCGPENCNGSSAPGNYDWYGSFFHFYPQVSQWLGGDTPPPTGDVLKNGESQSFDVARTATQTWTLELPANVSQLTVTISGSGDADLYVKRAAINWPGDRGQHDEAEFKAPYSSGSNESVTFTNPGSGTWNVLVDGYSASAGTITATWQVGGGTGSGIVDWARATPHNYANRKTYSYTYTKSGANRVGVHFVRLDTEDNYDFVSIKDGSGNTIYRVSGNLISNGSGSAFGRTDGWAYVDGDSITVELVTDRSVTDWGYQTDKASFE